jgi:hypothetical protein
MRAAKTVVIGFVETVARDIGLLRVAPAAPGFQPGFSIVLRFHPAGRRFDKRGGGVHPQRAMTTASTRPAGLVGLISFVVIAILP